MPRTPTVTRDQVPEELREAFDAETAATGGGGDQRARFGNDSQPGDAPPGQ